MYFWYYPYHTLAVVELKSMAVRPIHSICDLIVSENTNVVHFSCDLVKYSTCSMNKVFV